MCVEREAEGESAPGGRRGAAPSTKRPLAPCVSCEACARARNQSINPRQHVVPRRRRGHHYRTHLRSLLPGDLPAMCGWVCAW